MNAWLEKLLANLTTVGAWVGLGGQACFAIRWVFQWLATERAKTVVVPPFFWILSLSGAILVTISGILDANPVLLAGGLPGLIIFTRNFMLMKRPPAREP